MDIALPGDYNPQIHGLQDSKKILKLDRISLLVVHPTSEFDLSSRALNGISEIANLIRSENGKIITLIHSKLIDSRYFFLSDQKNSNEFNIFSTAGQHDIQPNCCEIYLVGGFFGSCFRRALVHLLKNLKNTGIIHVQINIPMRAVYYEQKQLLSEYLKNKSQIEFVNFIKESLSLMDPLNTSDIHHDLALPLQFYFNGVSINRNRPLPTKSSDLKIELLRNGNEISPISGNGEIRVRLNFLD